MFKSATLKLTIWYVIILVSISLLFSVVIYSIALSEVGARLTNLHQTSSPVSSMDSAFFDIIRDAQIHEAENSLIGALVITNLVIWWIRKLSSRQANASSDRSRTRSPVTFH
jgi:sensor histidine kinase YesM